MSDSQVFRWLFIAIALAAISISGYFRRKARQSGEVIARTREGGWTLMLRLLFAAPLYLSILAYMVNPAWMRWSSLPLPAWLRWVGAAAGVGALPLLYWVMRSIGQNISETFLTKERHVLVTHGPYRWVRHPLYSVATLGLASLSLVAANWFILAMAVIAFLAIALFVVPREEAELLKKFGREYEAYRARAGTFVPRLRLFE